MTVTDSVICKEQEAGHVLILLSAVKQRNNVQEHVRVKKLYPYLYYRSQFILKVMEIW